MIRSMDRPLTMARWSKGALELFANFTVFVVPVLPSLPNLMQVIETSGGKVAVR
ncbi:hypothetical protein [Streptomyces sp. NPDC058295]|uniref:hypothetical protein n=1 Tax=Streptomyces sp. NPDC058295 TaxID=3346431 RepID=UPI0036E6E5F8